MQSFVMDSLLIGIIGVGALLVIVYLFLYESLEEGTPEMHGAAADAARNLDADVSEVGFAVARPVSRMPKGLGEPEQEQT